MAVGFPTKVDYATGDVLSATNMNDLSGTVNLLESAQYAAGKNAILNGDFSVNQYGLNATGVSYTANSPVIDRWLPAASGATGTASLQAFTLGAAPVAGYESTSFFRMATSVGNDYCRAIQRIESVRTFANQSVTLSFWAKGTNPTTAGKLNVSLTQFFGTGGSPSSQVDTSEQDLVLTANWTRYSYTFTLASITGKTLGTNNNDYIAVNIGQLANASTQSWTLDLWGVQLEEGVTASPFQTATGTKQGELAACQRYYYRATVNAIGNRFAIGMNSNTTDSVPLINFPVTMRTNPTALEQTGTATDYSILQGGTITVCATVPTFSSATTQSSTITASVASGLTLGFASLLRAATTNAYLGWSAEL